MRQRLDLLRLQPCALQHSHCQLLRLRQLQPTKFHVEVDVPQPRLVTAAGEQHLCPPALQVAQEVAQFPLLVGRPHRICPRREARDGFKVVPNHQARHLPQDGECHLTALLRVQQMPFHLQLFFDDLLEHLPHAVTDLRAREVVLEAEE